MTHFDEMFDFVVVGSGGGSMCAGLVMRSVGKSVLILEKTGLVGGTTARSGGVMWIPNNPFMARDGIEDSYEKAAAYLDAVLPDPKDAPGASRARRATYLTEAPRMLEFLGSRGVKLTRVKEWPDYYDDLPGGSVPGRTVVAELFDANGAPLHPLVPGGPRQRELAWRGGVNLVMYALTGNYKADQVHAKDLLERLSH